MAWTSACSSECAPLGVPPPSLLFLLACTAEGESITRFCSLSDFRHPRSEDAP
jgi:hypothetical protein